jgi:RNA polymerase sigma-70 factor (ECF subfamily)
LTEGALERLLSRLDPDPARAAERYETVRAQLVKFFECRGCLTPRELADETFDRVARRLEEGEEVSSADPSAYFYGVAQNVMREHLRSPERRAASLEEMSPTGLAAEPETERSFMSERLFECLEGCLKKLSEEDRLLIVAYYEEGEVGGKIARRQALAERLGMTHNNLRIRIHRLRVRLRRCVNECVGGDDES